MNAAVLIALCVYGAVACVLIGFLVGRAYGVAKGVAIGWQDGYFRRIADDKARRDRSGRFVAVKPKPNTQPKSSPMVFDSTGRDWRTL